MAGPVRVIDGKLAMVALLLVCAFIAKSPPLSGDANPVRATRPLLRETQWAELGESGPQGFQAMWRLLESDPRRTVAMLSERLRPATAHADDLQIARLIKQLDDSEFQRRAAATAALRKFGTRARRSLQQTKATSESAEVRRRATFLLRHIAGERPSSPEQRRRLRAIRILEHFGSPEAERVLKRLAAGADWALETRQARVALKRLRLFAKSGRGLKQMADMRVGRFDWPQWGGTSHRNNTPVGVEIPHTWNTKTGHNIKWKAKLGSQTYGTPVVANGKVFIGTNNGAAYLKRYPSRVDLGVLLCFDEKIGRFLWQYSSPKLKTGRVNDWPYQGMPCTPVVDGKRLWAVTNRCEVVCLDVEGFRDGKNNGPYRDEPNENRDEADVVWKFDMMGELGVFPHNMSHCSMVTAGGRLFVCTSNGVDASHINLPGPNAPSFICMDRDTGQVLWTDKSPGTNILHGQWASPTYAVLGGRPQVIFPAGDGWLYSFDPKGDGTGKSKLLWKFDTNPKESKWTLGGGGTRNSIIGFACIYRGMLYIANGQDPEHGEGKGRVWCIDPRKRADGSDVSPELAVDANGKRIPHRRLQAVNRKAGERAIPNPLSAVVWHYDSAGDLNGNNKLDFEEEMHRTLGTPAIKDGLLVIADISGLVHCLDAKTGKAHWTYDMFAMSWGSALIVDRKIYVCDHDGDVAIFPLTANPKKALKPVNGELKPALGEITMENSIYSTPVVANNVLYITNKNTLYAIQTTGK